MERISAEIICKTRKETQACNKEEKEKPKYVKTVEKQRNNPLHPLVDFRLESGRVYPGKRDAVAYELRFNV